MTAVLPPMPAATMVVAFFAVILGTTVTPATSLDAAITDSNPRIFVAPLPPVLNTRTLTDYDVRRFFTQFGAEPNGVWSNPIGDYVGERDDMELRNTYMYGLDVLFHRQLLQSPLRVHSSAEADVVFLPIYADIGCRLSQEKEEDAKAWKQAIETFWSTFQQTYPDADRKPHFVVTGRREAENMGGCPIEGKMYNGKVDACNFLCHPFAKNLLMLTVEVYTGSLEQMGEKALRPNSVVVPWPGHWHLHLGSRYFSADFDRRAHVAARQYLAMESLKVRLPLREQLFKSCNERSDQCLHYAPRGRISQFNQSEIYDIIKSAWYCIQPPGDGPSRHATMDCLAADTMPVFFDQHLTAVMPFSDIIDYSEFTEYIDPQELQATQANAIDVLQSAFTEEKALEKARQLHKIKHIFLYAHNPAHSLIRWHEAYAVHPLDDAFTSSMKALLRRSCELGMLGKCEKAEAGKATARGTARSAAPKGLLQPRGVSGAQSASTDIAADSKAAISGDSEAALADDSVSTNVSTGNGGRGASHGAAAQSDTEPIVPPQDSSGGQEDSGSRSNYDMLAALPDNGAGESEGGNGDSNKAAMQEDSLSDSSNSADVAAQTNLQSEQSDSVDASEEVAAGKAEGEGDDKEVALDVTKLPELMNAPSLSSRKGSPGGSGDGSPAVKHGDSVKFPDRDERDVAVAEAVDASQQALSESDQSAAATTQGAEERDSEGHSTGSGDGSPAKKRGDSIRFPNHDEREVAVAEARSAAEAEKIEETQSLSMDDVAV